MKKTLFYGLIMLMTLALLGIILVQYFWIHNSLESEEEQLSFAVEQSLREVADKIKLQESDFYYFTLNKLRDSIGLKNGKSITEFFMIQRDNENNETITFANTIIAESFKFPDIFDYNLDSIALSKVTGKFVKTVVSDQRVDNVPVQLESRIESIIGLDEVEKKIIDEAIANYTASLPISKRISEEKIKEYIKEAFKKYNIDSDFEFAIYDHNILTKVHSKGFDNTSSALYSVAVFSNPPRHTTTNYELKVNLLSKQKLIYASVFELSLLSLAFTLIIIISFYLSLSQWIIQRKISQIKSDFINNMTHEFKTPIATINLALDSLSNPKIKNDPSRTEAYHNMIREENRRMHAQVENVLRISKLEKRDLNLEKEALHLHEVLASAINHVSLIVDQHNGKIETSFMATADTFLGNKSHFTNVLINMLDNAIKYSENAPEIFIKTELLKNKIHLSIADKGIGMSKAAQKRIFEKFYREHTGDIHNVKGHGLGLAYAKRILDDHNCHIFVESEKGVGSTFTIQIPLIT